jgi:SPP1 gp7 family putative phage head morphogenesis protein
MATNSKIGKRYTQNRPSNIILPRSKSLSVQSIKTWKDALTLAQLPDAPNRLPLLQVYDSILIDSHLQSILESRILRILGSKFKLINKAGTENKELNNLFKKKWFMQFLTHAMWSRFLGTGVVELWDLDELGELTFCGLIPRENTLPKKGLIVKEVGDEKGYPYKEGPLENYYIQIGEDDDLGILAKAAPDALTKKFAKAAWAEYVEKYGIPPRVVTTDSHNDKRIQELADMLQSMVSNHWVVLQGNEKLEMMPTSSVDAHSTFDNLIKRMNSEMSKRILGQDGTTDSSDTKGTYGSLKVLQNVADDRHDSDKAFMDYLINDELLWRLELISPAYSALREHRFEWDDSKELTPEELVKLVTQITGAGYIVDPKYIEEKTSLPIIGRIDQTQPPTDSGEKKKPKLSAEFHQEIRAMYPVINSTSFTAEGNGFEKDILSWAREIYYNEDAPRINWGITNKIAESLLPAIDPKKKSPQASGGNEDGFYANLQSNIFVFSAAKTFTQYADISALIVDEKGVVRPFGEFKELVLQLHEKYNVHYLKTEYNQALRTAQMAGKWANYDRLKDLYDLRFDTAGDDKVRKDHEKLDGITRPVDDKFWDKYYPPLDWGCRCQARQVAKGTPLTPEEKLKGIPKVPKAFQFNAGKQQLIFVSDHPYIKVLEKNSPRELQAVKDYGLKEAKSIYAIGKNLLKPLKELSSTDDAKNWFDKLADKAKAIFRAKIGKAYIRVELKEERFRHIIDDNKELRWKWIHNLPKMLEAADEIYVLNYKPDRVKQTFKTYRFITFFEDKIRIVNVDENYIVQTAYETSIANANNERQGILIFSKK